MVYENPVDQGGHCMRSVVWVGRWEFLNGWTKVWSCDRDADELVGARLLLEEAFTGQVRIRLDTMLANG